MKTIIRLNTALELVLSCILVFTVTSCTKDFYRSVAVTTKAVSAVTGNTATATGRIIDEGEAGAAQYGHCWDTIAAPTILKNKTELGSTTERLDFTSNLINLTPNTKYYVRTYATDKQDDNAAVYGAEINFTTASDSQMVLLPSLTTNAVSAITQTTGTCGGNVTSDGGATVTERGICWSTTQNPVVTGSHTPCGSGIGTFTGSITGLTNSTKYYVRAYATNTVGTAYGNEVSFTAGQSITAPVVTTTAASSIAQTTATSGGIVTSSGGATVTARGVCWSTSQTPVVTDSHTISGTGTGSFTSNITGLTANTTYYVRAYATNSAGTSYGNQVSFTTLQNISVPTLTTTATSNIAQTTATSGGNVTSDGGATVTARGVCWSTTQNPMTTGSHTTDGTGTGIFLSSVTGLTVNTTYYVRAYATNSVGTCYGNQISFTTLNITVPTITTAAASSIAQTAVTTGGNVTSAGGATVTARGVSWSTSQSPDITDSWNPCGSGTGSFSSDIIGLTSNTTYYVRAYATNSAGTNYGNQISFTTLQGVPTIVTDVTSSITISTATSGGEITSDGGATVTDRGVCWSTSQSPDITSNHLHGGTGTGSFTGSLTNLNANTTYYVRAYATNSVGTGYGNQRSFSTCSSTYCIGQSYQGGVIAYIDGTGLHGLIAAPSDQSTGAEWGCLLTVIGGTSTVFGTGQANTTLIVNTCLTAGIAARLCNDLVLSGYTDWFLPSKDELNKLYINQSAIGGFASNWYWSSSEVAGAETDFIWQQFFVNGNQGYTFKSTPRYVRAVRTF